MALVSEAESVVTLSVHHSSGHVRQQTVVWFAADLEAGVEKRGPATQLLSLFSSDCDRSWAVAAAAHI